ncbi:MAG TPA: zinc ribbon domain-containing protein [Patescibacteria group bacterium]|nr:zinc ribbon domain-containing protein [Patescibacteria group bacterium]
MPIFEYSCNGCDKTFELLVKRYDEEVQCPHCGSPDVEKLFSPFARSCSGCDSCGST